MAAGSVSIQDVLSDSRLSAAWGRVRANKGCAGVDGQDIFEFEANLAANLAQLKAEVIEGRYRPRPLLRVEIPKRSGGTRILSIPAVRDRVLQTAVAQVLTPVFEQEFEDCSFAYRPGRSVSAAVARIIALRDKGYKWVVDADIDDFFNEIDHSLLMREVERLVRDPYILRLIKLWVEAGAGGGQAQKGLPQGSPISPLLANLYLDRFDEEFLKKGMRLVRYADDFIILCKDREKAREAMELSEDVLKALELELNDEKSRIVDFNQGFRFLGVQFIRSLVFKVKHSGKEEGADTKIEGRGKAPLLDGRAEKALPEVFVEKKDEVQEKGELHKDAACEDRVPEEDESRMPYGHDPRLRTLYLVKHGYVLGKTSERLVVRYKGKVVKEVPAINVDQVMVYGNSQITTQAMRFCLERSIPIFLMSLGGRYYGAVDSFDTAPVLLQKKQFERAQEPGFCLGLARAFIRGKILNAKVVLLRYARKREAPALRAASARLGVLVRRLEQVDNLEKLRGIEGVAARDYFDAVAASLDRQWGFKGREKRPPPDPVNVLLSFGYTVLFFNVYSLLKARGLNPHVGFLHPVRRGHPGLASDMMEEFRAIVVDAVVFNLLFNNRVKLDDFEKEAAGTRCLMKDKARRTLIKALEAKFNSTLMHPWAGARMDYRRCMEYQVNHLAGLVSGRAEGPYRPFLLR